MGKSSYRTNFSGFAFCPGKYQLIVGLLFSIPNLFAYQLKDSSYIYLKSLRSELDEGMRIFVSE